MGAMGGNRPYSQKVVGAMPPAPLYFQRLIIFSRHGAQQVLLLLLFFYDPQYSIPEGIKY